MLRAGRLLGCAVGGLGAAARIGRAHQRQLLTPAVATGAEQGQRRHGGLGAAAAAVLLFGTATTGLFGGPAAELEAAPSSSGRGELPVYSKAEVEKHTTKETRIWVTHKVRSRWISAAFS